MEQGWGAWLLGDEKDLDDWRDLLGSFDPYVVMDGEKTVLRSKALDHLESAEAVRSRSIEMIQVLNGALAISHATRPVTFGGAAEFTADGQRRYIVMGEMHATIRVRAQFRAQLLATDGTILPNVPEPTLPQRWTNAAEASDTLRDALIYFGRSDNWFDLYKCCECLENFHCGEHEFNRLKQVKATANYFRHYKYHYKPKKLLEIREARSIISSILQKTLNDKSTAL
jgi:hypothetical protein